MVYELAGDVLRALQKRSVLFHHHTPIGDSISRVMVDSFGLQATLNALIFAPLHATVLTVAMAVVLLKINAGLGLASLIAAVSMTMASRLLGRSIRRSTREARDAESQLQSHLHQALSGVAIVQAFVGERRERLRFEDYADDIVRKHGRSAILGRLNQLGYGLPGAIGTAIILWLGAGLDLDGELKVGTLLLFMTYLGALTAQVRILAGIYGALQGSRAFIDRVLEVLDAAPEVIEHPAARTIGRARGHVCLVDVSFGYEPDRLVLEGVDLEARPGETVALVGRSGAGKTTLLSLVSRMFDPVSGAVLLDGHDIRGLTLHSLREQVAVVLQEPFLFPVSIAENIAYGRPDATRADIEAAARTANAHDFITELPDGYETVVGERGGTLSGGQRQRVSIARALLKDAPVLVLDEPTSALDPVSERLLLDALKRLMAGRTTLMIAHRLSTVRDADKIVVMDAGKVLEVGTHRTLLRRKGAYAGMYAAQDRVRTRGGQPTLQDVLT
jgi:ATP-binding cassette subfamily B protein/subfamily B ATP-binding cassette protein MsbA